MLLRYSGRVFLANGVFEHYKPGCVSYDCPFVQIPFCFIFIPEPNTCWRCQTETGNYGLFTRLWSNSSTTTIRCEATSFDMNISNFKNTALQKTSIQHNGCIYVSLQLRNHLRFNVIVVMDATLHPIWKWSLCLINSPHLGGFWSMVMVGFQIVVSVFTCFRIYEEFILICTISNDMQI